VNLLPPSGDPAASVLQAPGGLRTDVTVFCLNARALSQSGSGPVFRRNEAERVYTIEALMTRRSQVQILPPLLRKGARKGAFRFGRDFFVREERPDVGAEEAPF